MIANSSPVVHTEYLPVVHSYLVQLCSTWYLSAWHEYNSTRTTCMYVRTFQGMYVISNGLLVLPLLPNLMYVHVWLRNKEGFHTSGRSDQIHPHFNNFHDLQQAAVYCLYCTW